MFYGWAIKGTADRIFKFLENFFKKGVDKVEKLDYYVHDDSSCSNQSTPHRRYPT